MVFYFSGTGNSEWVAKEIAKQTNDRLAFIPTELGGEMRYELTADEAMGFVFPCYSWGVPPVIQHFVEELEMFIKQDRDSSDVSRYPFIYFVVTCGDDTGQLSEQFCQIVESRGWKCDIGYAVQMPESYICLPGFDVDPKDKEKAKIQEAHERLKEVISDINARRTNRFDTMPGSFAWFKSGIIRPIFNALLSSPRLFRATSDCTSCGTCESVCPFGNISLVEQTKSGASQRTPHWGSECVMCLRCYHSCPKHAIRWGMFTDNKGQYLARIDKD